MTNAKVDVYIEAICDSLGETYTDPELKVAVRNAQGADCQVVGDCHVGHLPGMTSAEWTANIDGNATDGAIDGAIDGEISVADQQCKSALRPRLAILVDTIKPNW